MDCNSQIHDELKNMMELNCPFCDKQLVEINKADDSCCSGQELVNIDGINKCVNCGVVHGYVYVAEYFNFHDNMYKIRNKSVYHRKYHTENVLNTISGENNIQLTPKQRDQIQKVFIEIDSILHMVNAGWK